MSMQTAINTRSNQGEGSRITHVEPTFLLLHCTDEPVPRISKVSSNMLALLGYKDEQPEWTEVICSSMYHLLPIEDRILFRNVLSDVRATSDMRSLSLALLDSKGKRITVSGWIRYVESRAGVGKYELYLLRGRSPEEQARSLRGSYLATLSRAYDAVIYLRRDKRKVRVVKASQNSCFFDLLDISMSFDRALSYWVDGHVESESREQVREFLINLVSSEEGRGLFIPRTEFRMVRGETHVLCQLVALIPDADAVILCVCEKELHLALGNEDESERGPGGKMQNHVDNIIELFAWGSALFRLKGKEVCIDFVSDRTREALGLSARRCQQLSKSWIPLEEVLDRCGMSQGQFESLMEREPVAISLLNTKTSTTEHIRINLIDPNREIEGDHQVVLTSDSMPWMHPKDLQTSEGSWFVNEIPHIFIRAFGRFDIFVDGIPMVFSNPKEKELLALLVDLRGGTLNSRSAVDYLWEGEPVSDRLMNRYRKLGVRLKKTLETYGIENLVRTVSGVRSLDTSQVTCDYFEYLEGKDRPQVRFHGAYMEEYSWAETTKGYLYDMLDYER